MEGFFFVKDDLLTRVQYRVSTALGLRVLTWMDKRPFEGRGGRSKWKKNPRLENLKNEFHLKRGRVLGNERCISKNHGTEDLSHETKNAWSSWLERGAT